MTTTTTTTTTTTDDDDRLTTGEAFSNPASYSMIPDLFPPEKRPTANGIFASAVYIGGGMASLSEAIAEDIG
jgi:MFS family permease